MLKVPIEIELDVLGMPPTDFRQVEGRELLKLIEDCGSKIVISEVTQAEVCQNVEVSSNQLVPQLEENDQVVSTIIQTQDEQDNPQIHQQGTVAEYESIDFLLLEQGLATVQPLTPGLKKKLTKRLLDSLNDSLTFTVNTVGTILFLGKLANYSWE